MHDPFDSDFFIIRVETHIIGIEPRISRSLELPIGMNFAQLHEVLQAAFGWTDSHLHKFLVGGLTIGAPELLEDENAGPRVLEASAIHLKDLTFPYEANPTLSITYVYDFGDNWCHMLALRRIPRESGAKYPRCISGSRSGPPEDVGGNPGYEEFLAAWFDPSHENHKDMRRWVGRKFDPLRFDLDATNKAITRAIRISKGGYRFRQMPPS